jgi:hypothetical protein
MVIVERDDPL